MRLIRLLLPGSAWENVAKPFGKVPTYWALRGIEEFFIMRLTCTLEFFMIISLSLRYTIRTRRESFLSLK